MAGHPGQPALDVGDLGALFLGEPVPADVGLLHRVLGVGHRAEQPVGQRDQTALADHASPAPAVDVEAALSPEQIAAVGWLAVAINGWNRIAIASHYPVAP
jgi:hypothetical protein